MFSRVMESLKSDPIHALDEATLKAGASLFARTLLLALPVHALYVVNVISPRWLDRRFSQGGQAVLALAMVLYFVYCLGVADAWRTGTAVTGALRRPQAMLAAGFSLWWRSALSAVRFVWIPLVLGVLVVLTMRRRTAESALTFLEVALYPPISTLALGLGSRLLDRQRELEAGTYVPGGRPTPAEKGSTNPFL